MPTRRLVIAVSQTKRKQPHVPTQRLLIAVSLKKRRQPHVPTQRHVIALNHGKKTLLHVHITHLKEIPFVHSKEINMHCLNPSLLQRMPISRT